MEGSTVRPQLIIIGRIIRPIGLKGEVLVESLTFDNNRFWMLKEVCIEDERGINYLSIKSVRFHKKNVAISFYNYERQEDILPFIGAYIKIDKSLSPILPEGTYYYYQLENLDVFDEQGEYLGKVSHIMKAGGSDVYTVKNEDGRELLIPAIRDSILNIDLDRKKMIVRVLEMY